MAERARGRNIIGWRRSWEKGVSDWGEGRGEGRADTNLEERKTRKDHGDVELLARLRISDECEGCGKDREGERQGDAVHWVNNVDVRENMARKGKMNTLRILITKDSKKMSRACEYKKEKRSRRRITSYRYTADPPAKKRNSETTPNEVERKKHRTK
jgi:hypothetical protein